jgi:threonyl-tRNA synthetase
MHNNYILVIGETEQESKCVAVRNYKTKEQTVEKLTEFTARIVDEIKTRSL